MNPQAKISLRGLNQIELRDLVDAYAEEYRDVLKIRLKNKGLSALIEEVGIRRGSSAGFFDVDTGAIAVVEHRVGGVATRQVIQLNNGFRKECPMTYAKFVQQGPFIRYENGQKITYIKHGNYRIEYKGQQVTRVVGPNKIEIPAAKFRDFKIFPNEQHAEMRILQWAERNNYRILAMAPTRGCCPHCALRMKQYFIKENINIDDAIPKSRQTRSLWRSFLKKMRQPPATPEYTVKGKPLDVAALRAKFKTQMTAFKTPNPQLMRISRFLKVAGPAMLAFDAATSYAKAADQWDKGERDAAAETLAEFGGRAAGAFVGAEACALALGGCGSVIPGLGTTVGALAGVLIGGAVGAYLGEKGARQLCDQIINWTKGGHPPAPKARSESLKPHATHPEVAKLQQEMRAAGYGAPEVDFIGRHLHNQPGSVFEHIGSELVPPGALTEEDTSLSRYPVISEPDLVVRAASGGRVSPHPPAVPSQTDARRGTPVAPQVQRHVVSTVHAELIKPHVQTQSRTPTQFEIPESSEVGTVFKPSTRREDEDSPNADLSQRLDVLRSRLKDYDALATGAPSSRNEFDADLSELRAIQDRLTLSGGSTLELYTQQVKLNEVRNRYEQIESDARSAEDRKLEIIRRQQEEERWRETQAALEARAAEHRDDPTKRQQAEDQDLRSVEERERKEIERERREDLEHAEKRQQREQEEDARDLVARKEQEARWQAEDERKREDARLADERKALESQRQQEIDARKRTAQAEDERKRDDTRRDEDARRALERQQEIDARKRTAQAEDERKRDDTRRDEDARRALERQQEIDAHKRTAQAEDERKRDDTRRDEDARRALESQRQQEIDARNRTAQAEDVEGRHGKDCRILNEDEARQYAEDARKRTDEAARLSQDVRRVQEEKDAQRRAEDARRQADDEARRREEERRSQDERNYSQLRAEEKRRIEDEQSRRADELRQREEDRKREDQQLQAKTITRSDARYEQGTRHVADDRRDLDGAKRRTDEERQRAGQPDGDAGSKGTRPPEVDDHQSRSAREEAERRLREQQFDESQRQQKLEQQRHAEEESRRRQLEEERRREEKESRRQQEEQQRREEEWRRQQEQQRREEEWRRQQEEQQRREEEWRRQQEEEQQRREEEWRRQQEEEQQRREEEWRRQQEEQQRREEEWRRQQEEQQRREEEWRRQQEEQQRREEEWRRQQEEEERRRRAEEEERSKQVTGKILWPGQDPYP